LKPLFPSTVLVGLLLAVTACGGFETVDPPSGAEAMAPRLSISQDGRALLTWLESEPGEKTHRLRFSSLRGSRWAQPTTIFEGEGFFANWADVPGVVDDGQGLLYAHWLEKLGEGTYAYGAQLARSEDGGRSWEKVGLLHDDSSLTEHGFVSYVGSPEGARAFWLDGRAMPANEGSMQLRTALLSKVRAGQPSAAPISVLLDDKVCECCSTDAALAASGPVVVYRDRSDAEIRDISLVRWAGSGWSSPVTVAVDDWQISGCPVNGPAVDASGNRVVVAWFTAARSRGSVRVAFSEDGGASFGSPLIVDEDAPMGRVDIALDDSGDAWVLWMAKAGRIDLQRVASDGAESEPIRVAQSSSSRAAGFPVMQRVGERLTIVWRQGSALQGVALSTKSPSLP